VDRDRFISQADKTDAARGGVDGVVDAENPGAASIEVWGEGKIVLNVRGEAGATVDVRQYYFPSWQARDVTTGDGLSAQAAPVSGLLRILAPGGTHRIELKVVPTLWERLGQALSAISLAILVAVFFVPRRI
jgi:hypothetical protein